MGFSRTKSFNFEQTTWQQSCSEILSVRHRVFMIEQGFSDQVLCDIQDPDCYHIIVYSPDDGLSSDRLLDNRVIATGRLTQQGRIGRIAVLLPYRGAGIGSEILDILIQTGRHHQLHNISLSAELDSQHFFGSQHFSASGPVYMKQGVPHQVLTRKLA